MYISVITYWCRKNDSNLNFRKGFMFLEIENTGYNCYWEEEEVIFFAN